MKKLILIATLILHGQINAQCVKLYVKEHLSGDPICQLSNGDYLELCLDDKEVNGCPRNLYIYDMGFSAGSETYELSLDKGWRTHYMTLMVNTTTKRFGFILQGQTALYSYYTENEMKDREEQENKQRRAQEVLYRKSDQEKYPIIDEALAAGNVELFKKSINSLHYPKSYPNYRAYEKMEEARKQKEDENLLKTLNTLIANNQPEQAAKDYSKLHEKRSDIRINISEALAKKIYAEKISITLPDKLLRRIIENNKTNFDGFTEGTYKLTIDPSGVVYVNEKQILHDSTLIQYKTFGVGSNFKMPIFSDAVLDIKISRIKHGQEYVVVSTQKKIYETNKGDYYIGSFFKTSLFKIKDGWEYNTKTDAVYNPKVKNKHYQIKQKFIETTSVNGVETSSFIKDQIIREQHFKKRWGTALRRSLVLTVVPFFTTLRLVESSKIP